MKTIELTINEEGNVCGLMPDDLDMTVYGRCRVRRISNVNFDNARQQHVIILANGQELGEGFATRREALEFEVRWAQDRIDNDRIEEVLK